jgi:hypothetical protein
MARWFEWKSKAVVGNPRDTVKAIYEPGLISRVLRRCGL